MIYKREDWTGGIRWKSEAVKCLNTQFSELFLIAVIVDLWREAVEVIWHKKDSAKLVHCEMGSC